MPNDVAGFGNTLRSAISGDMKQLTGGLN